ESWQVLNSRPINFDPILEKRRGLWPRFPEVICLMVAQTDMKRLCNPLMKSSTFENAPRNDVDATECEPNSSQCLRKLMNARPFFSCSFGTLPSLRTKFLPLRT